MTSIILPLLSGMLGVVMGQLPGHGAWDGSGYGTGWGMTGFGGPSPAAARPKVLTCNVGPASSGPRLRVTIRDNQNSGLTGSGLLSPLALSPVFGAFASLGAGWGSQQNGGLEIDIEVFLLRNLPGAVFAFTEYAPPPNMNNACPVQSFGQILSPSSGAGQSLGFPGTFSQAGLSPFGGAFTPPQAGSRFRDSPAVSAPGVVATEDVRAGISQTFRVNALQGFRLEELAGRGFIVCDSISYDWSWRPVCDSPMMDVCCGMTYSNEAGTDYTIVAHSV